MQEKNREQKECRGWLEARGADDGGGKSGERKPLKGSSSVSEVKVGRGSRLGNL